MAYSPATLVVLADVRDGSTPKIWYYTSTDSVVTMSATGYFTDAASKGLRAGDVIFTSEGARLTIGSVSAGVGSVGNLSAMTPGAGITNGTGTIHRSWITNEGPVIKTSILMDLTGLNSGGTAADVIGVNGAGAAYIGQITTAKNGLIFEGRITCLETPAGGDTDIDVYSATEATGVEDSAIGDLTETQLVNSGAFTVGLTDAFTAWPAANSYLYLVGQGTANATYTAGQFLIELRGAVV